MYCIKNTLVVANKISVVCCSPIKFYYSFLTKNESGFYYVNPRSGRKMDPRIFSTSILPGLSSMERVILGSFENLFCRDKKGVGWYTENLYWRHPSCSNDVLSLLWKGWKKDCLRWNYSANWQEERLLLLPAVVYTGGNVWKDDYSGLEMNNIL